MRCLRRILVPTDGSHFSSAALDVAVFLADPAGADIEVLQIWDLRSHGWTSPEEASAIDDPIPLDAPDRIDIHRRVLFGNVCDTIVRVANTERFDLLIIGLNEMLIAPRNFGRDLVERVAAASQCPVIAVTGPVA
jgi:nucleotide-binding universal stress UspA family protein